MVRIIIVIIVVIVVRILVIRIRTVRIRVISNNNTCSMLLVGHCHSHATAPLASNRR